MLTEDPGSNFQHDDVPPWTYLRHAFERTNNRLSKLREAGQLGGICKELADVPYTLLALEHP